MAYSTQQDCERHAGGAARLVELCDQAAAGSMDAAALVILAAAQEIADRFIDGWARKFYAVPIVAPSPVIVALAADQTVYQLKCWRNVAGDEDHRLNEQRIAWLERMNADAVTPGDDPPTSSELLEYDVEDEEESTRDSFKGFA